MLNRILGEFPIFAKLAKLGRKTNAKGNVLPTESNNAFANADRLSYETGVEQVTPELFNGAMNFVTGNINYLFHRGVPEFSLNVAYSKGSIVTFEGGLYVSFVDNNIKHVSQTSHWGRFVIESNSSHHNDYPNGKPKDTNPVGTILTVPVTIELDNYMDYVEGAEFNPVIYPELYKVLGSKRFGTGLGNKDLPIGSLVHILSTEDIPDGWVEWNRYSSLAGYPELHQALSRMVERLPIGPVKQAWTEALKQYRFPEFSASGFHVGMKGTVGDFINDASTAANLLSYPVVVDNSNTLNPLGVSRCAVDQHKEVVGATVSEKSYTSSVASPLVIVAHRAEQHKDVDAKMVVVSEDVAETVPKTLSTRLIVKATNQRPSSISSTHKQVIKYAN